MARGRKPANPAQEEIAEEVSVIEEVKPEVPDKRDEEIALLKEQIAAMKQMMEQMQSAQPQPVIQVATPEGERIHFIFEAEVADDNVFLIGENGMYGRITGKSGMFYVPKNDFSRINDGLFRLMLDKRWIIAVDGFSKEERESLGIDYKEGEYLDKKAFAKMVDLGDEMLTWMVTSSGMRFSSMSRRRKSYSVCEALGKPTSISLKPSLTSRSK